MELYLTNAAVFRLTNKPFDLLNGLTSNTLDQSKSAFLDKQGRVVTTIDQLKLNDDELLIVVQRPFVERLMQHLQKFLMFSETKFDATDLKVYFDLQSKHQPGAGEFVIPQKAGCLLLTSKSYPSTVSDEAFTEFRLQHQIPLQGVDYDAEMLLNIDPLAYTSFSKGCYLGQEIIARVHFKSRPPRKLVVAYADELDEAVRSTLTSVIVDDEGRQRGFAFVPNKA